MPGGFGTVDELFDILTLIQTKKKKPLPIILFNTEHWKGMVSWLKNTLVPAGTIAAGDLNLFHVVDTPEQVQEIIQSFLNSDEAKSQHAQKIDFY